MELCRNSYGKRKDLTPSTRLFPKGDISILGSYLPGYSGSLRPCSVLALRSGDAHNAARRKMTGSIHTHPG